MQEQIPHIEGLKNDYRPPVDLQNDTPPNAILCEFKAEKVYMPFLSQEKKQHIEQSFVYVVRSFDLGRSIHRDRIKDKVSLNPETGKWEVDELAQGSIGTVSVNGKSHQVPMSDILRNPSEWNAFVRGLSIDHLGTPLSSLFKGDPARVSNYERAGIKTIEMLAGQGSVAHHLGIGAADDVEKAKRYLERQKELAPSVYMEEALNAKEQRINELEEKIADLTDKLTQVLQAQVEVNEKKAKSAKKEEK